MSIWGWLGSLALGLLVNEWSDLSPAVARWLVCWSAHRRYSDATRAEERAEELAAYVNDRPGKLFKLIVALGFAARGLAGSGARAGAATPTAMSPSPEPLTVRFEFPPYRHEDAAVWPARAQRMRNEWDLLADDVQDVLAAHGKWPWGSLSYQLGRLAKLTGEAGWRILAGEVDRLSSPLMEIERMPDAGAGPYIGSCAGRAALRPERYATPTEAQVSEFCEAVRRCRQEVRQLTG